MSHRHEWFMDGDYSGGAWASCEECREKLWPADIERRLNATECLSAEDATSLYRVGCFEDYPELIGKLLQYAEAFDD
jgi:hypothetical protein